MKPPHEIRRSKDLSLWKRIRWGYLHRLPTRCEIQAAFVDFANRRLGYCNEMAGRGVGLARPHSG